MTAMESRMSGKNGNIMGLERSVNNLSPIPITITPKNMRTNILGEIFKSNEKSHLVIAMTTPPINIRITERIIIENATSQAVQILAAFVVIKCGIMIGQ